MLLHSDVILFPKDTQHPKSAFSHAFSFETASFSPCSSYTRSWNLPIPLPRMCFLLIPIELSPLLGPGPPCKCPYLCPCTPPLFSFSPHSMLFVYLFPCWQLMPVWYSCAGCALLKEHQVEVVQVCLSKQESEWMRQAGRRAPIAKWLEQVAGWEKIILLHTA